MYQLKDCLLPSLHLKTELMMDHQSCPTQKADPNAMEKYLFSPGGTDHFIHRTCGNTWT